MTSQRSPPEMTSACTVNSVTVSAVWAGVARMPTIAQAAALKEQKAMALLDKKRAKEEEKRKKKVRACVVVLCVCMCVCVCVCVHTCAGLRTSRTVVACVCALKVRVAMECKATALPWSLISLPATMASVSVWHA
jgi:hypothetical protein